MIQAVFLDREGVVTPKMGEGKYLLDPDAAMLVTGVPEALRSLQDRGLALFIVSNQSCVSRGLITLALAEAVHCRVLALLAEQGIRIVDSRLCPHVDTDACGCRKPKPGMILDLCRRKRVLPNESIMIGDSWIDMQAAKAAGCAMRILIADKPDSRDPTVPTFSSLAAGVHWMAESGII